MGSAIAKRFAEEGASLVLTDISAGRLGQAVAEVEACLAPNAKIYSQRASVLVREEARSVVDAGVEACGPIDILINVVGGIRSQHMFQPFLEMSEERWNATMDLNLKGNFHLTQIVAPSMLERKYGRIVNIASIIFAGAAGQCDYGAAKAAVASMTRSLALEFAPHVNVNCISPATIKTSVIDRLTTEEQDFWRNQIVLKRFGEREEIANAVLFLASDESSFMTGEIMSVAGGIWPAL
ncbi:SDR family oxidoreductase [Mesorhizobium sp. IRAMC:0171]|uniref:SDR family oxidoreductase n=2 Tax=Mesorhizobium retamae TaxID=2912854 RepID=A0ABS9QD82_9HYPH|nr:SDR family oxidoreductase [Mesorhizobium sp. IRAMC:0171]